MYLILKLFSLLSIFSILHGDIIDELKSVNYINKIEKVNNFQIENNQTIISSINLYHLYAKRLIENGTVTVDMIDYYLNNRVKALSYYELLIKLFYTYSVEKDFKSSKLYLEKVLRESDSNLFNSFESVLITDIAINLDFPIKNELYSINLCNILYLREDIRHGCISNYFLLKKLNNLNYDLDTVPENLRTYVSNFKKRGE